MVNHFLNINKPNTILIVDDNIKQRIISLKTKEEFRLKAIFKFKVLSVSEFITLATFNVDDDIFLNDEPVSLIKSKIKFARYNLQQSNGMLNDFILSNSKYINKNKDFILNIKSYQYFILGSDIYLKPIFKFYNINYEALVVGSVNKDLRVLKFLKQEEEVFYLFENISKALKKGIDINNIYVANSDDSYNGILLKHSHLYNIPIAFSQNVSLYDIPFIKELLKEDYDTLVSILSDEEKLLEKFMSLNNIDPENFDLYINDLIGIINKYSNNKNKKKLMEVIINDAKNKQFNEEYSEAVKFIKVEEILTLEQKDIVFIVNAKYESFPNIVKNSDLLSDGEKRLINYPESSLVNEAYNTYYKDILNKKNILYVSYSTKDKYFEFEASDIINDLKGEIEEVSLSINNLSVGFSKDLYRQTFSTKDNNKLLTSFTGRFNLNGEERLKLINYLKDLNITISPSLVANYLRVPFVYYVEKILKISTFKESIYIRIGNFFHLMAEAYLTLKYYDYFEIKDNYTHHKKLNRAIIYFLVQNEKNELKSPDLFFDDFYQMYFDAFIENNDTLDIKTLFYVKKNKEIFIKALEFLINKTDSEYVSSIYVEKEIDFDNVFAKSDLIQIYNDNSFSIIDYKASKKSAYTVNKLNELLDDLVNKRDVNIEDLDLMQPFFYANYLTKVNEKLKFRDAGFYSFFYQNPKINSLMKENLNKDFYTGGRARLINDDDLLNVYKKLDQISNQVLEDILRAKFEINVLKDKNNKKDLETEWLSQYEAIAFFNKNELGGEDDEDKIND